MMSTEMQWDGLYSWNMAVKGYKLLRRDRKRRRREKEKKKRRKEKGVDGDSKKKKKKRKKEKKSEKAKKGAVTESWGKYGVIRETDMW